MRGLALGLVLAGCIADPDGDPGGEPIGSEPADAEWTFGPEVVCAEPEEAFSTLAEGGEARGLDRPIPVSEFAEFGHYLVSVLAVDVDDDGDVDLALSRQDLDLDLYLNDGAGQFTASDALHTPSQSPWTDGLAWAFVDVDGDRLPELVETSFSGLTLRRATAPGSWGPAEAIWDSTGGPYERAAWRTIAAGDLDGDGDLDLVLASLHGAFDPFDGDDSPPPGEAELLFFGDGAGGFDGPERLVSDAGVGMSQMVLLSDRDADGDLDVFVGSDLEGPQWAPGTLFENRGLQDGELVLEDVGAATGALIPASHMGADGADLNGDGQLDYCFTDVGPVICLESDPSGVYVDTRAVHDLVPSTMDIPRYWTGWSIELADLDNDGLDDVVAAAGRVDDFIEVEGSDERPWESDQPNGIWQATAQGAWADRGETLGFGSIRESFGLATADLDGDGSLEVVIGNEVGLPSLWSAGCSEGAWLEVDLVGPGANAHALGATVIVQDGDVSWIQEVHALRSVGQGPARLHFGLGDREAVDLVTVRWPGGATSEHHDVPTRRFVRVEHPERAD